MNSFQTIFKDYKHQILLGSTLGAVSLYQFFSGDMFGGSALLVGAAAGSFLNKKRLRFETEPFLCLYQLWLYLEIINLPE